MSLPLAGLRPEQGPALSVPLRFFFSAPLALVGAGLWLISSGGERVNQLALVHFGTVGFLLFVMVGALYQMLPVVAGVVVPLRWAGPLVHGLLVVGASALLAAQATDHSGLFSLAAGLMSFALLGFLGPALWAAARTSVTSPTGWGLRLALTALAMVGLAGARLAWARGGHIFEGDWLSLRLAHVHLGFVTWLGGLITSVSWQVLPMFYLVKAPAQRLVWVMLIGLAVSLLGLSVVMVAGAPRVLALVLIAPGALVVWGLEPAWAAWALHGRKRKRADATVRLWWLSLACAPVCLVLGAGAAFTDLDVLPRVYGWVVLWGWAGAVVHAMLMRIVPFLVWFHWCAPRIGQVGVPTVRELLPDQAVAVGAGLHFATCCVGVLAMVLPEPLSWRTLGAALVLTGGWMSWVLWGAVARGRRFVLATRNS